MERIELFDTKQLAQRWNMSEAHVTKLRQNGELSFIKLGARCGIRFRLIEDVRSFENSRALNQKPSAKELYRSIRAAAAEFGKVATANPAS